jgi:hypothetical protein
LLLASLCVAVSVAVRWRDGWYAMACSLLRVAMSIGEGGIMAGYVYIIGNVPNRLYKIGISTDVAKRLQTIQTGSPYPLTLIEVCECEDPRSVEKELHKICAQFRIQGEWFKMPQTFLGIAKRSIRHHRLNNKWRTK